jgi:hypothetical protein
MNRRTAVRVAFTFAFALIALVTVKARAQEQLPVLESCLQDGSYITDGDDGMDSILFTNNCGVRIHARWGVYDEDSDSGTMQYSQDLFPGQTVTSPFYYGVAYIVGCPDTPSPGHPTGYKLAYSSNHSTAVTSWTHVDSLDCVLW